MLTNNFRKYLMKKVSTPCAGYKKLNIEKYAIDDLAKNLNFSHTVFVAYLFQLDLISHNAYTKIYPFH